MAKAKRKTKPIKAKSKSKPRHARRAAPTPMAFGLSHALVALIERLGGTVAVSDTVNRMMVHQPGMAPFTVDLKSGGITELPHAQPGHDTSTFGATEGETKPEAPPEAAT